MSVWGNQPLLIKVAASGLWRYFKVVARNYGDISGYRQVERPSFLDTGRHRTRRG